MNLGFVSSGKAVEKQRLDRGVVARAPIIKSVDRAPFGHLSAPH